MATTKVLPQNEFNPVSAMDYLPVFQLRDIQFNRLKSTIRRAYENVDPYRERLQRQGITPVSLQSFSDLPQFPFTVKDDLRATYPFGLFASPMQEVVRLHASSGTTGKPIVVAYTQEDLALWIEVMMRALAGCGVHQGDIIQNSFGYGLFTGGLGYHYGAEALGATVVPTSGGNTERQIMILKDFGVTVICCTPSYFLHILECAKEIDVSLEELPLRAGFFGAEPWTDAMRSHIEQEAGIKAYDLYGLSEIIGPGVACECPAQDGLHILEDHFYAEIVDPGTDTPLPEGSEGELVLTTLTKQALPMIRYRTRDITSIIPEPCACGRTGRRIRRIARRSDDMFIIRGVNVYPSQIEDALLAVEETQPHYQIILTREKGLDQIEVQVEVTPDVFTDKVQILEELRKKVVRQIERRTGIRAAITLSEPHTLKRSEGKAERLIDKRNS
jgi:phenylacetate-CoA ligase